MKVYNLGIGVAKKRGFLRNSRFIEAEKSDLLSEVRLVLLVAM